MTISLTTFLESLVSCEGSNENVFHIVPHEHQSTSFVVVIQPILTLSNLPSLVPDKMCILSLRIFSLNNDILAVVPEILPSKRFHKALHQGIRE